MAWLYLIFAVIFLCPSYGDGNDTHISSPNTNDNLTNALNEFGYKIMKKLLKQGSSDNIVISPTGIAGLLAIALLGTVGKTYDELAETLGFSQDILANRVNHEQLGKLLQSIEAGGETQTHYADAVFVDARTQLRDVYRSYLARVYRADALGVHFQRRDEVREIINGWVRNHTDGRIEKFLKQDLPSSTSVVLVSTLYFIGQWAQPFLLDQTKKMPFMKPDGEIMADLMLNFGEFKYIFAPEYNLQMIALPYNDTATTMYVLKPRQPKLQTLPELLDRLEYDTINRLINQMTPEKCVVRYPKMDLQSYVSLDNSLKELGVQTMFIPGQANFALMVDGNVEINGRVGTEADGKSLKQAVNSLPNPGLHIDSVIHDVKITVNEYGTEAVAATAGLLSRTAEQFYVDSPFYMFIRNDNTKLITFSALVFDPTVQGIV